MSTENILVITERDPIQRVFQEAEGQPSRLFFARQGSEARHILRSKAMSAVISDNQASLGRGAEILKWVHEKHPAIPLMLLRSEGERDPIADKEIGQFVRIVPPPMSVEQAKALLASCLDNGPTSSAHSIELDEDSDLLSENPDEQIVQSIVDYVDQLPPLPVVVQNILQLMKQEETSARELAEVLSMDTALAARVLKLVNSSLYGLANPVTTIQRAVSVLGFSDLKNMTVGLKMIDTFAKSEDGIMDRDAFWEHSLACGFCAQSLSENIQHVFPEEAFLGGMLHDVGKLVLDSYLPDQWKVVQEQAQAKQILPIRVEEKVVGVPHTIVGQWLAERWKLPRLHQLAIKYHHEIPSEEEITPQERAYCAIMSAANSLVHWLDLGTSGYSPLNHLTEDLCDLAGLSEKQLDQILTKTVWEVSQWKQTFGMKDDGPAEDQTQSPDAEQETTGDRPRVFVVTAPMKRIPSIQTLVSTLGYEVHYELFGDNLLNSSKNFSHEAIIMELGLSSGGPEQILEFLRATRSNTSAPILLLAGKELKLPASKDLKSTYLFRGVANRGSLKKLLTKILTTG